MDSRVPPTVPSRRGARRDLPSVLQHQYRRLDAHGFRFLFLLDALALFGLAVLTGLARFGVPWEGRSSADFAWRFAAVTVLQIVVCYFAGLYEREPRLGARSWLSKAVTSMAIGVGAQAALIAIDVYLMPRGNLLPWAIAATVALILNRALSRRLAARRQGPVRVALVGDAEAIGLARRHFAAAHETAVVACTLPSIAGLTSAVAAHQVSDVLLLDVEAFNDVFPHPLTELEAQGVSFLQRVGAQETLLGLNEVREVAGLPCVRLRSHSLPNHQHRLKRGFDLLLLLLLAVPALLAGALLACWVRLRAGAPVLYRQVRTGKDGVPFQLVKFRTMRRDAEQHGAELSTAGDTRVVPGLGWMRSTRGDELPQLWNVLRGEMSIVGPRPERPEFTSDFALRIPGYARRSELPPGITGLAQVSGRYDTDAAYKVGYDLQYVSNWSPLLDLQILLRTVWVIVMRRV
jgi:exopolysaccharide biosynthesis polyprenyl glycosylphosphotransferase